MSSAPTLIALLHGPDQRGLVARVAGWIFARGGNILHADQHRDMEEGVFFHSSGHQGFSVAHSDDDLRTAVQAIARAASITAAERAQSD